MRRNMVRGFTLIETAAVIGMVSLLVGVTLPAVQRARTDMRGAQSAANLAFIGQGTAMYAADHEGRLFTYTWRPGFHDMPDGKTRFSTNATQASSWQNIEILMRRTGRIDGEDRIRNFAGRLVHRRYSHLVLMDYLDEPFPSDRWADPADANLLQWQANPADISADNNIPYASGSDFNGYDDPGGWVDVGVRQRWAFASSYQRTVSAWNPDGLNGEPSYVPTASTPHLFVRTGLLDLPAGRNFAEVAFPSARVHMFEEFDRRQAGSPYFGYDHAVPLKVMFDGSINDRPSGVATPSWNPADGKQEWRQTYVPIHTFPIPLGGLGDQTLLSQRYRWTLGGLRGIDYAAPLMRR
ncbi:MAG: type II secretion system GspH family protein [Phycisphaerales bacterium]|nr:type II secretion system protein [Planctomycetota bacterium]MCH8508408.1 type II secretion system GspH family protein [Phycisphaerales bacterium]